ncbi:MAG: hypothetical protein Q7R65_02420, partial [bacterium]|nr:hypothetical protein [bacterium]
DLSWWRLESNNQFFSLPKNTKILAYGKLPLSSAVTGLNVNPQGVALLYPNGSVAYSSKVAAMADSGSVTAPAQKTKAPAVINDEAPKISPTAMSTQKNQKTSPELAVAPVSLSPASQVATALQAFDEQKSVEKINQLSEEGGANQSSSLWLYGAVGIIILGLGFVLLPKSAVTKNPADDFTIIE